MRKSITLHDIAEAAGVSFNTVSRALNDKPDISAKTRQHVLETASRLDYHPNRLARGLRQRRTSTIGVVVADLANTFFAEVVEGIERVATDKGYSIILANSEERGDRELAAVRTLVEHQVDGVLIAPTQHQRSALEYLSHRGVPYCLLARFFDGFTEDAVVNDDQAGARMAVAYLLAGGHRRILFINGPSRVSSARWRLAGYHQAHAEAGLQIDEGLIVETEARMEDGLAAVRRSLDEKPGFSAVFCFSDYLSFGAIQALRAADLSIPGDVAVMGYDDVALAAAFNPALTTVRIAKMLLGRIAGEKLISRLEGVEPAGETTADKVTTLTPELVIRSSA